MRARPAMHSQVHVCTWRYSLSGSRYLGGSDRRHVAAKAPLARETSRACERNLPQVRSVPSTRATTATLSSIFRLSQGEPIHCDILHGNAATNAKGMGT